MAGGWINCVWPVVSIIDASCVHKNQKKEKFQISGQNLEGHLIDGGCAKTCVEQRAIFVAALLEQLTKDFLT